MKRFFLSAGVIFLAGCSAGPSSPSPGAATPGRASAGSLSGLQVPNLPGTDAVRGLADGDIKNGPLEILRVRIRQGSSGFYASPSGTYRIALGLPVELWVEWSSDQPVAQPPRLVVDWSLNEPENIHCGPCLLTQTYRTEGRYTVTVTLDDRVGGTTRRSFILQTDSGPGPDVRIVSESTGLPPPFTWSMTLRFLPFKGQDIFVTLTNIALFRADTQAQVSTEPPLVLGTFSAAQLPYDLPLAGQAPCSATGGNDWFLRFTVEIVAADGTPSALEVRGQPSPCF